MFASAFDYLVAMSEEFGECHATMEGVMYGQSLHEHTHSASHAFVAATVPYRREQHLFVAGELRHEKSESRGE